MYSYALKLKGGARGAAGRARDAVKDQFVSGKEQAIDKVRSAIGTVCASGQQLGDALNKSDVQGVLSAMKPLAKLAGASGLAQCSGPGGGSGAAGANSGGNFYGAGVSRRGNFAALGSALGQGCNALDNVAHYIEKGQQLSEAWQ